MKTNIKLIPIHNYVISELKKSPEQGAEVLKNVLPKIDTNSKLYLISRIIEEVGTTAAKSILTTLPAKQTETLDCLSMIYLPLEKLHRLINFLVESKSIGTINLPELYFNLAMLQTEHNDRSCFDLFELCLHPSLPSIKRHKADIYLAYKALSDNSIEKSDHHFSQALMLESTGKIEAIYVKSYGIIADFLKRFRACLELDFKNSLKILETVIKHSPEDARVIAAAREYISKGIKSLSRSFNIQLVRYLFDLIVKYPIVNDRGPEILDFLLKAPEAKDALSFKANFYYKLKQYDKGKELAKLALTKDSSNIEALSTLAFCYVELSKLSKAEPLFLKLLNDKSLTAEQHKYTLRLLTTTHQTMGNHAQAIYYAEQSISQYPDDISAYISQIVATLFLSEVNRAKKLLAKANLRFGSDPKLVYYQEQLFPENVQPSFNDEATLLEVLGEIYYHIKNKDYDLAEKKGLFLLEREKHKNPVHFALAEVFEKQQQYAKALEHYQATKNVKQESTTIARIMECHYHLKQFEAAEEQAWWILLKEKSPTRRGLKYRKEAILTLFLIYYSTDRFDECRQKLEKALALEDISESEKQKLHYYLARIHYSAGDFDQALDQAKLALTQSLDEVPDDLYLIQGLAAYFSQKGFQALVPLRKYLKTHPNEIEPHIILGYSLYFNCPKRQKEALNHFLHALELDPSCITKLKEVLPADVIEQIENVDNTPSLEPDEPLQIHLPADEKPEAKPCLQTLIEPQFAEYKTSLSAEQISHRFFQSEKFRKTRELEAKLRKDKASQEAIEELWQLSSHSINDKTAGLAQIGYKNQARSQLLAYLDKESLKNCPEELLSSWQELLDAGLVVGKKGQKGIRLLDSKEAAKIAEKLGTGYVAKLKLLGHFGEIRGYGRLIPSQRNPKKQVLCFDKTIEKSHSI